MPARRWQGGTRHRRCRTNADQAWQAGGTGSCSSVLRVERDGNRRRGHAPDGAGSPVTTPVLGQGWTPSCAKAPPLSLMLRRNVDTQHDCSVKAWYWRISTPQERAAPHHLCASTHRHVAKNARARAACLEGEWRNAAAGNRARASITSPASRRRCRSAPRRTSAAAEPPAAGAPGARPTTRSARHRAPSASRYANRPARPGRRRPAR